MKNASLVTLLALLLFIPAMADRPAVGFWLVERNMLADAVNKAGGLAKVSEADLDDIVMCHGRFKGDCDLWLEANTTRFHLKAIDDGKTIGFSISFVLTHVKMPSRVAEGKMDVEGILVAMDGWEKVSTVLLMKRLNLKQ
jgi:hypothetical protein